MRIDRVIAVGKETAVEPVVVHQHDKGSCEICLHVMDGGNAYDLTGMTADFYFRKNGATSLPYRGTIEDSLVSLTVPEAVTENAGVGEMQVAFAKSGFLLHSFKLMFEVKSSLSFVGETESPADDPMAVNWKNLPGKPGTFPPSAHTHTPAQAGALAAGGTAVNAAKLGGKLPESYLRPQNLLDNSDFTQPINEHGKTSYSGAGYTIDRWLLTNANASLTVSSKYILLKASGGTAYLRQYIQPIAGMNGKTYTVAVCTNGGLVITASGVLTEDAVTSETTFTSIATVTTGVTLRLTKLASGMISLRIDVTDGNNVSLRWAALYEGSYTADTLPNYQYKGYAAELAECQRYFRRTNAESTYATIGMGMARSTTSAWINVPRSSRMRIAKPTVTVTGSLRLYAGSSFVESTAITVDKISDSFISLNVTASGLTAGAAVIAATGDTAEFYIDENANL